MNHDEFIASTEKLNRLIQTNWSEFGKFSRAILDNKPETFQGRLDDARENPSEVLYKDRTGKFFVNLGGFVYSSQKMPGLNRIGSKLSEEAPGKHSGLLYLSVAPRVFGTHCDDPLQRSQAYLHQALQEVRKAAEHKDANGAVLGRRVNILALGSAAENIEIYLSNHSSENYTVTSTKVDPVDAEGIVSYGRTHYDISDNTNSSSIQRAQIYSLDVHAREANITESDYDMLYKVVAKAVIPQEKNHQNTPLIIHCAQGLDRGGRFTFGALIFANFEAIFSAKNPQQQLLDLYKNLKLDRGPEVLEGERNIRLSFSLGFMLKIIEIQDKISKALRSSTQSPVKTDLFNSAKKLSVRQTLDVINRRIDAIKSKQYFFSRVTPEQKLLGALARVLGMRIQMSEYLIENKVQLSEEQVAQLNSGSLADMDASGAASRGPVSGP